MLDRVSTRCFAVSSFLLLILASLSLPVTAQETSWTARAARLTSMQGTVTVTDGNNPAVPAQMNLPLLTGVQLATGADGQAEIEFEDGSIARLTPNSALSLDTLAVDPNGVFTTNLSLLSGLAYFELRATPEYIYSINAGDDVLSPWASGYAWGWTPYRCGTWSYYSSFGWGWAPGAACGGTGWGFAGGGFGVNIGAVPRGYRTIRVPIAKPGPRRPVLPVHLSGSSPVRGPAPGAQRGPRTIAGVTAKPIAPVAGGYVAGDGAPGGSLGRDFPIDRATHTPAMGLASTRPATVYTVGPPQVQAGRQQAGQPQSGQQQPGRAGQQLSAQPSQGRQNGGRQGGANSAAPAAQSQLPETIYGSGRPPAAAADRQQGPTQPGAQGAAQGHGNSQGSYVQPEHSTTQQGQQRPAQQNPPPRSQQPAPERPTYAQPPAQEQHSAPQHPSYAPPPPETHQNYSPPPSPPPHENYTPPPSPPPAPHESAPPPSAPSAPPPSRR